MGTQYGKKSKPNHTFWHPNWVIIDTSSLQSDAPYPPGSRLAGFDKRKILLLEFAEFWTTRICILHRAFTKTQRKHLTDSTSARCLALHPAPSPTSSSPMVQGGRVLRTQNLMPLRANMHGMSTDWRSIPPLGPKWR
jgi:hypothetical protein